MTDDLAKCGPPRSKHINLQQEQQLRYWMKAFGLTEQQLRAVVVLVGNDPGKVRVALRGR